MVNPRALARSIYFLVSNISDFVYLSLTFNPTAFTFALFYCFASDSLMLDTDNIPKDSDSELDCTAFL
jgi:hypothetical protein